MIVSSCCAGQAVIAHDRDPEGLGEFAVRTALGAQDVPVTGAWTGRDMRLIILSFTVVLAVWRATNMALNDNILQR